MKGLELFARSLKVSGVNFCVLAQDKGLEDFSRAFSEQGIDVLTPISETASAMIADGYARASRKPGLIIAREEIPKLITGITSAWADKTPLILISIISEAGKDFSSESGRKGPDFKEIFKPITRFQAQVIQAKEIPEFLIRAFQEAVCLRGGPVFLEVAGAAFKEKALRWFLLALPRF